MHIITQKRIWEAKERWPQAAAALDAWYRLMKSSDPGSFAEMKSLFPATDKVGKQHVFDIGGNKIRLIAVVHYRFRKIYIQHVLDHTEYDKGHWKE
ncbi:type II toxin-antitoxin system HigB family toxin [Halomonas campisalis]|uniref:Type II toxin-antitoxin system HigB family toxin n=1 Tax=Billgrantia campisalis TaxID=74661 RepID=A0ABS9PBF7_9GAMM|nr:type II toxin-antitoxin system HigB family toxin [Halomonas campisalis]MCG6659088.1 type II toxin-antitoxin system HigB family toxin [Halomonas campisalis]MDR5863878.1 type II toxin-antitoxin system HigB family toxin [Halomonas campisalis]